MREKKKSNSGFSKYFDIFGSILLAVVLVIVAWNFVKDGRAFEKSALSAAGGSGGQKAANGSDGYKTLKYSKPSSGGKSSSGGTSGKSSGKSGANGKSAAGSDSKSGSAGKSTGGKSHGGSKPAQNP